MVQSARSNSGTGLGWGLQYACWKLSYNEDFFANEEERGYLSWQDYERPGLCPVAEYLQPRMFQFKVRSSFLGVIRATYLYPPCTYDRPMSAVSLCKNWFDDRWNLIPLMTCTPHTRL